MEWQPIETAPKATKPEEVIALIGFVPDPTGEYAPETGVTIIWWEPLMNGGCWVDDCARENVTPTHWMPLPPPPA